MHSGNLSTRDNIKLNCNNTNSSVFIIVYLIPSMLNCYAQSLEIAHFSPMCSYKISKMLSPHREKKQSIIFDNVPPNINNHLFYNNEVSHFYIRTFHLNNSLPRKFFVFLPVELFISSPTSDVINGFPHHGNRYYKCLK